MKKQILILLLMPLAALIGQKEKEPYDYVNPFIGTDDMGHTFPGAAVPFGLVQLSPDTDTIMYSYGKGYNPVVYRYCAGYQYSDKTIVGFSHTHFNGTGHSDLGDLLIMPTVGQLRLNPGTKENPDAGYRSRFSHSTEKASPGYYAVRLDDYKIDVELTATERAGFHKYKFPASREAHIILDLTAGIYNYDGKTVWSFVQVENKTLITGYRQTNGWARTRFIYFAIEFSKPFKSYGLINEDQLIYKGFWRRWKEDENFPERAGSRIKCHFDFDTGEGEEITVKVAISGVSTKNALENLKSEIGTRNFEEIKEYAKEKWKAELSKITIKGSEERKVNFYTALYRSFLNPSLFNDVNGEYRGLDQNIHKVANGNNYTVFSLWDTYRALHPLYTIIQQKRTADIINSMLAHYRQSIHKILPVWSHWANENWCMIGYHAVPVIADAYLKGIEGFDAELALEACVASANYDPYDGIGYYKKLGFVPEDISSNSASKTLEYAYDDWTIYKFAEKLGQLKTAELFKQRGFNYKNIFDPSVKFMRARNSDGSFKTPFDPLGLANQGFIEGNAWNYSLYVPHDMKGFINLLGGNEKLVEWLDTLFAYNLPEIYMGESEDVTRVGIIGNYVHGNEPSHHVPYLYNYAGQPWKTEQKIHEIVNKMYKPQPHGLCGNDDCGQMSAWYIFSLIGFYPVAPASNQYVIGSPCVENATIKLENGKTFDIKAENFSETNIYIKEVILNGKRINRSYITHDEIMKGGDLIFVMQAVPNKKWAVDAGSFPYSLTN